MAHVYKPTHQKQINSADPYGGAGCVAYSTAMAIDRATLGGVFVTGKTVRASSNEPVPDPRSPGLNLPQVINVAFGWHVPLVNRIDAPWSALMAALRQFRGVILLGDYDQIPAEYSGQVSYRGDHAVYVNHVAGSGNLYWDDPLRSGAIEIPEKIARAYAEKLGKATGHGTGILFATTRITPLIP